MRKHSSRISLRPHPKLNQTTENRLHPSYKESSLSIGQAKILFRTLCKSSMMLGSVEDGIESFLAKDRTMDEYNRGLATSSCEHVTTLRDKVIVLKDTVQKYIQARPEMLETQSGYVTAQLQVFSKYFSFVDTKSMITESRKVSEALTDLNIQLHTLSCCNVHNVIAPALALLEETVNFYGE